MLRMCDCEWHQSFWDKIQVTAVRKAVYLMSRVNYRIITLTVTKNATISQCYNKNSDHCKNVLPVRISHTRHDTPGGSVPASPGSRSAQWHSPASRAARPTSPVTRPRWHCHRSPDQSRPPLSTCCPVGAAEGQPSHLPAGRGCSTLHTGSNTNVQPPYHVLKTPDKNCAIYNTAVWQVTSNTG